MPDPTRILVTGCTGQLGAELLALPWSRRFQVEGRSRESLDITSRAAVDAAIGDNVDLVINAAAYTAVDRAESEAEAAHAVNELGVGYLAEACARSGATMIHVSTDYVFDGTKADPYLEDDPIGPLGIYGKSKAAGEAVLRRVLPRHIILRTAWLYAAQGSNFVKTVLRLAAERDTLRIVADQQGTPTSAHDLAGAIASIADRVAGEDRRAAPSLWGTYHCTNGGATTWHGLAREITRQSEPWRGRGPEVVPIATADYPTAARRPTNSRLDCAKLERGLGLRMRPWQNALQDVLGTLYRTHCHPSTLEEKT